MATALVLGAGMVGTVIAQDLAADPAIDVVLADRRPQALARAASRIGRVRTIEADLSDPGEVAALAAQADVVCGALASHLGFQTLKAVVDAGRPYCDISFMPEDAWELDAYARERGVTAVVDCGVAPGMSNLLAGVAARRLSPCESIAIYVGGLPVERRWPFQYKAGFAPADVLEEYTRPSRIVEHGQVVVRPALSEPELLDLFGVGTVEAFNTDGLRSLAYTLQVPFMKEKTLRWPGHIELMRVFRETGLFSKEPITVGDAVVRPLDVTSALLFPKWTYEEGEADLTVMRVEGVGVRGGERIKLWWDLYDRYDPVSGNTSMSRTTAFPCAIVARKLLDGSLRMPGVIVPERLAGVEGLLDHLLTELAARGVTYVERSVSLAL